MADLVVPRLGVSVTEVEILEWLIADGDPVKPGDPVISVSTDKTEVEIEATATGTLRHKAAVGEVHQVGDSIGAIE
jgi:pyruvate/2-oxoglutarate dehydrogenase complex dihydrolipoamide acyltransferase (E2) component